MKKTMAIVQKGNQQGSGKLKGAWSHLVFWNKPGDEEQYEMVYVQVDDLRDAATMAASLMDKGSPHAFIAERVGIIGPQVLSSLIAYVKPNGQVFEVREPSPVYT